MNSEFLIAGLVWYVVFLLSTTCHEAAHAWAARLGGDLTAFHGGQVSLDPIPHIRREPFGMVIFPLLTYATGGWMMGWASAPYDPLWSERFPRRAAWMSLAGPGANFALVILAAILIHVGIWTGFFHPPESVGFMHVVEPAAAGIASGAATFVSLLFSLNLLLGTFNLIPVPPLDGYGALGLLLPEDLGRRVQHFALSLGAFSVMACCWCGKSLAASSNPSSPSPCWRSTLARDTAPEKPDAMRISSQHLQVATRGKGLYEITDQIAVWVENVGVTAGLLTVFVQHTSASLTIQENADPDVVHDLNTFFNRLAPEDNRLYRHTAEGPDDMPAHIRAALTLTQVSIPIERGRLALGTWQGVYLFEHRAAPHRRSVLLHLMGEP